MRTLTIRAFLLIILASVTFSSCNHSEPAEMVRSAKGDVTLGGAMSIAVSERVESVLPETMTNATSTEIGIHLHASLLSLDPYTLEIIPSVAESWSVTDDGLIYVFKLRRDVMFHDDACFAGGSRNVTSKDFVFSFEKLCAAGSEAFTSTFRNRVTGANEFHEGERSELEGVEAIDDFTLQVQLLKPDPSFLYVLAGPAAGVLSERAINEYGDACHVGAGPFRYVSNDASLVLARNSDYFEKDAFGNRMPYVDTLRFVAIASKQEQLDAFFGGDIDLVTGLHIDPLRYILDAHISDFTGTDPKYVMERESESIGVETYRVYRAGIRGLGNDFLGYRDYSRVQIEQ